jgi:hypothetical protein
VVALIRFMTASLSFFGVVTFQRVYVELFCAAISIDKRFIQLVAHPKFYLWLTKIFTVCTLGWMLV